MVRAPCCEKMGLKKGPWTPEEDRILINYINLHGHSNWRALPKLAGLLRCGKSCRLRWINYLRPDIKRGNFTREEEDTIIKLHQILGNRWSAIAAKLPGRTDNEIKNVWHTHLKKRLNSSKQNTKRHQEDQKATMPVTGPHSLVSPRPSIPGDDMSSVTATGNTAVLEAITWDNLPEEADESFWSEVLSDDNSGNITASNNTIHDHSPQRSPSDVTSLLIPAWPTTAAGEFDDFFWRAVVMSADDSGLRSHDSPAAVIGDPIQHVHGYNLSTHDSMEFWYDLWTRADLPHS